MDWDRWRSRAADPVRQPGHRWHNRMIGEAAKLFVDAGVVVLTAFISPFIADRERVRALVGAADFIDVYCRCPLAVCEQRYRPTRH